jgi:hypothetical protein
MTRKPRALGVAILVALLGLTAQATLAQTVPMNANLGVSGHINACVTGPSGTTGNAYACTLGFALSAPALQGCYAFIADVPSTGAATINYSGTGAKAIVKVQGGIATPLATNDIRAGQVVHTCYDGTNMQCQNCTGNLLAGTALTLSADGSTITSQKSRVTTANASQTLGTADGPIVACTAAADVTLTLPPASGTQTRWTIVKVDAGVGACKVQRGGTDTINGGTLTVDATAQWVRIDVDAVSASAWSSLVGFLTLDLATQATGILPAANLPALVRSTSFGAQDFAVEGSCALGAAAALVTNGPRRAAVTCTASNTDGIDVDLLMPDNWNGGTITVTLAAVYSGTTHAGHVFDMNFSGQCVRHGDPVAAFAITSGVTAESASNVEVQLTASGTANRELLGTSAPITLAGTCAGGAHVYVHGLVDNSSTTFTPLSELKLVGLKLEYTGQGSE